MVLRFFSKPEGRNGKVISRWHLFGKAHVDIEIPPGRARSLGVALIRAAEDADQ